MISQASSQKAMITSCALRFSVRSPDRKLVLASCWVIVLPPWRTPPPLHVGDKRAADPARVDPPVAAEAAVLDRDEGVGGVRLELGDLDRRFLDRAAPGDGGAVRRLDQQRRILERLERARQRRGQDQPQQSDDEQPARAHRAPACQRGRRGGSRRRLGLEHQRRERIGQILDRPPAAGPHAGLVGRRFAVAHCLH